MERQSTSPRGSNRLLQIPGEIRNQIYTCLFTSTRLTFGKRPIGKAKVKSIKPAPNSLALLQTCRQINQEAKTLWPGLVLFSFEDVQDMLDKFAVLPSTTLSQIRHARVGGPTLILRVPDYGENTYYRLVWVLKLLPGLCLDRLTVMGPKYGAFAYDTVNGLIKYGDGWKELNFITPNSEMLGFAMNEFWPDQYWRKPQPRTWNKDIIKRDGEGSGASVTIYRSTQVNAPGSVINPCTRQPFEQRIREEYLQYFGVMEDGKLLSGKETNREVLVIVKRGRHVDVTEGDGSPSVAGEDIRHWTGDMTWPEIRRLCIDYPDDKDKEEGEVVEADSYLSVDEYSWKLADYSST